MRRALRRSGLAAVLVCAGAAAFPSAADPPRTHRIEIRGLAFLPRTVRVAPGDTVVWRNEDVVPHTVTPDEPARHSGDLPPGAEFRLVVERQGLLSYTCLYHPDMEGRLVVDERSAAPALVLPPVSPAPHPVGPRPAP